MQHMIGQRFLERNSTELQSERYNGICETHTYAAKLGESGVSID